MAILDHFRCFIPIFLAETPIFLSSSSHPKLPRPIRHVTVAGAMSSSATSSARQDAPHRALLAALSDSRASTSLTQRISARKEAWNMGEWYGMGERCGTVWFLHGPVCCENSEASYETYGFR